MELVVHNTGRVLKARRGDDHDLARNYLQRHASATSPCIGHCMATSGLLEVLLQTCLVGDEGAGDSPEAHINSRHLLRPRVLAMRQGDTPIIGLSGLWYETTGQSTSPNGKGHTP